MRTLALGGARRCGTADHQMHRHNACVSIGGEEKRKKKKKRLTVKITSRTLESFCLDAYLCRENLWIHTHYINGQEIIAKDALTGHNHFTVGL